MPRDLGTLPDLERPTLENLSWLLRHQEAWPPGFRWAYAHPDGCAIGLATRQWGGPVGFITLRDAEYWMRRTFKLWLDDFVDDVFFNYARKRKTRMIRVRPEQIATEIDRYLLERA